MPTADPIVSTIFRSSPLVAPDVLGIWYDARDPYENMTYFNLVMVNLNEEYVMLDANVG